MSASLTARFEFSLVFTLLVMTSQVMWRRYPCSCPACMAQQWDGCQAKALVGELETVVEPGAEMYFHPRQRKGEFRVSIGQAH